MVVRTGGVNKVALILGELYAIHPDPPRSTLFNANYGRMDGGAAVYHANCSRLNEGSKATEPTKLRSNRPKTTANPSSAQTT